MILTFLSKNLSKTTLFVT